MVVAHGEVDLDAVAIERDADALAASGFKVLILAAGPVALAPGEEFGAAPLHGLAFLGLVGMIDPLRPDAAASVRACRPRA